MCCRFLFLFHFYSDSSSFYVFFFQWGVRVPYISLLLFGRGERAWLPLFVLYNRPIWRDGLRISLLAIMGHGDLEHSACRAKPELFLFVTKWKGRFEIPKVWNSHAFFAFYEPLKKGESSFAIHAFFFSLCQKKCRTNSCRPQDIRPMNISVTSNNHDLSKQKRKREIMSILFLFDLLFSFIPTPGGSAECARPVQIHKRVTSPSKVVVPSWLASS